MSLLHFFKACVGSVTSGGGNTGGGNTGGGNTGGGNNGGGNTGGGTQTCEWQDTGVACFRNQPVTVPVACPQPVDSLQARALSMAKDGADWKDAENVRMVIFEWGVPFASGTTKLPIPGDVPKWNALADIVLRYFACRDVDVAPFATGHEWGSSNNGAGQGYILNPYEFSSANPSATNTITDSPIAPPIRNYHTNIANRSYINVAGEEFWCIDRNDPWQCTHRPDQAPNVQMLDQLADRGIDSVRYPLGQQPPAGGTTWLFDCATEQVDPAFIGHVENLLNNLLETKNGMQTVLDPLHPGNGDLYNTICGENIKTAEGTRLYKAYITSLMNHSWTYKGTTYTVMTHPALEGVDPVNEAHSNHNDPAMNMDKNEWEAWSADIILWYRNTLGFTKTLFVGPAEYNSLRFLPTNHPNGIWWNDPLNNTVLAPHFYPDLNNAGIYGNGMETYQENLDGVGNWTFTVPDCVVCDPNYGNGDCLEYIEQKEIDQDGNVCGGTRHVRNGSVSDVSGLVPCECEDNGGGNNDDKCTEMSTVMPPLGPVSSSAFEDIFPEPALGYAQVYSSMESVNYTSGDSGRGLRVTYPAGAIGGSSAVGGEWYFQQATKEKWLSYSVEFDNDFEFVLGGKLPGLGGGSTPSGGVGGGCGVGGTGGYSMRLQWGGGTGEPNMIGYLYYQGQNATFGEEIDLGFVPQQGVKYNVKIGVDIGTAGNNDGWYRIYINGALLAQANNINFICAGETWTNNAFMFSTFYGGNTPNWAPNNDNTLIFADFCAGNTESEV